MASDVQIPIVVTCLYVLSVIYGILPLNIVPEEGHFLECVIAIYAFGIIILTFSHYLILPNYTYQIVWRTELLGWLFGCGILIFVVAHSAIKPFGLYMCYMSFFHFSEYVTTAWINPDKVTLDSFLLNHSLEYGVAALFSWGEFWIECYSYPVMKTYTTVTYVGVVICFVGELLRKLAMLTAKSNFSHVIQNEREDGHVLVQHGIYNFFRHPSYVGWFYWSVGTQIILLNPICAVSYFLVSWRFFNARIYMEEVTLIEFFGEDYVKYQEKVGTGLPFIKGCRDFEIVFEED